MELIRNIHNLHPRHEGCVLTIGNFDGVHLGHQAVIGQLAQKAAELHLPSVLMSFEPYPQEFFNPAAALPRLTRFREKMLVLRRFAVDRVLCLRFDEWLAEMAARDFITELLVKRLGVRYLVVGDDFRFGWQREGDFGLLQESGARHGFQVARMHTVELGGRRISSTRIRAALAQGQMELAERMLGRPYRMCGRVAHGDKRGRDLGFPTANIHLHRMVSPVNGVFAVELFGVTGEPVTGVANVGIRPTVSGTQARLEVHLFDFSENIYGAHVHVDFLHKIREERRFDSLQELVKQIELDIGDARDFFAGIGSP